MTTSSCFNITKLYKCILNTNLLTFSEKDSIVQVNNRNAPVRTQSLGVGDSGRFIARGGAPPRFRAPPLPSDDWRFHPPDNRRRIDLFDTSSDGEADFYEDTMVSGNGGMPGIADFRSLDRKRLNHEVNKVNLMF